MGYRSEIYIVVDNALVDEFNDILKEHDLVDALRKIAPDTGDIR